MAEIVWIRFLGVSESTIDDTDRREHDPDENHVGIGELVLADDPARS